MTGFLLLRLCLATGGLAEGGRAEDGLLLGATIMDGTAAGTMREPMDAPIEAPDSLARECTCGVWVFVREVFNLLRIRSDQRKGRLSNICLQCGSRTTGLLLINQSMSQFCTLIYLC